jgi:general L-amino acid transport system permease protein
MAVPAPEPNSGAARCARMAADWFGGHLAAQAILFVVLMAVLGLLGQTLAENLSRAGITLGFAFLSRPTNFEIGETLIAYSSQSSFGRAVVVGLINTLGVSAAGCLIATLIGVALGIARLSSNPLLTGSVRAYVEIIRNTPLLLQLFFWNSLLQALPPSRQALEPLPGLLLSNRGIFLPALRIEADAALHIAASVVVALAIWSLLAVRHRRGRHLPGSAAATILAIGVMLAAGLALSGLTIEVPQHRGFNIAGGLALTTEFSALLIGLVVNASAGISEIVRAGIASVPRGQWEAGRALGMHEGQILRTVVLPQALRVIVPLMTSSYLSLAKNSSLAVAIGFPDVVNILNTTANQTGQALEAILMMMGIYLSISVAVSLAMNRYNARHVLRALR